MSDSEPRKQRQPRAFSVPESSLGESHTKSKAAPAKKSAQKSQKRPATTVPPLKFEQTDEDFFAAEERGELDLVAPPPKDRRKNCGIRFGTIAFAALSFLITAAIGLWLQELVTNLIAQNTWLGWLALGATGALLISIVVLVAREILSIMRLRNTADLRGKIDDALKSNNTHDINKLTRKLESHFENQPMTAHGRAILNENRNEVMDAIDRYALTERELMGGLDKEAQQIVSNAAKRVSVVTAVSPRALIDIGYVLYENLRLIRVLCELYGGRTGLLGTVSLARRVVAHLAITGTIAVGEGIIQQLLGSGLAAKLSARLGEGVVNGIMTARIGLAAMEVCRPAPFHALERPKLSSFIATLTKLSGDKKTTENRAD